MTPVWTHEARRHGKLPRGRWLASPGRRARWRRIVVGLGLAFGAWTASAAPAPVAPGTAPDLAAPFQVAAGGSPIDVEVGHAAPWVADFDGDGLPDLLVGQFGNGKLRLYRNRGAAKMPEFSTFAWFQAGGADARVPAG